MRERISNAIGILVMAALLLLLSGAGADFMVPTGALTSQNISQFLR
jgi:hypothetical protein